MPICVKGHEVKILNSVAGYYIGTTELDDDSKIKCPYCRVSGYYKTKELAENALSKNEFVDRDAVEIMLCNGGEGCQLKYE